MRPAEPDPRQVVQRVRVGLIGLASVILLIGILGMILSSLRRDANNPPAGAANAQVAATLANVAEAGDPLADLGVAPGSAGQAAQNSQ